MDGRPKDGGVGVSWVKRGSARERAGGRGAGAGVSKGGKEAIGWPGPGEWRRGGGGGDACRMVRLGPKGGDWLVLLKSFALRLLASCS